MIPFKNRFHGHKSLNYVYRNGQVVRLRLMIIKYITNPHRKESRFSVVVSKKTLKSAVRRNRIRRRIYNFIRPKIISLNGVYDIVFIITSSEMLNISHDEMSEQLNQFFNQINSQKINKNLQKD